MYSTWVSTLTPVHCSRHGCNDQIHAGQGRVPAHTPCAHRSQGSLVSDEEREGGDHEHGHDAGAQSGGSGRCAFWIELAGAAVIVVRVADSLKNVFLRLIRQGATALVLPSHESTAMQAHFSKQWSPIAGLIHGRCPLCPPLPRIMTLCTLQTCCRRSQVCMKGMTPV